MGELNWGQRSNSELMDSWDRCMDGLLEGVSLFLSETNEDTPLTCRLLKNQLELAEQLNREMQKRVREELSKSSCIVFFTRCRSKIVPLQERIRHRGVIDLAKSTIAKLESPVHDRARLFRPIARRSPMPCAKGDAFGCSGCPMMYSSDSASEN